MLLRPQVLVAVTTMPAAAVVVPVPIPVEVPVAIAMEVPMVAVPVPMACVVPIVVAGVMPATVLWPMDIDTHAGVAVIAMAMAMPTVMRLCCFGSISAGQSGSAENHCGNRE